MHEIANFLKSIVKPYFRIRPTRANENGFRVRATSISQRVILINYLMKFPLLSSKRLDFMDWIKGHDIRLNRSYKDPKGLQILYNIKNSMNKQRIHFDWDHLDN